MLAATLLETFLFYMIFIIKFKILIISLCLLLTANNILSQKKGDVVLSISLGLFSRGLLSAKVFPVDNFAIELHGGLLPTTPIYNYGVALHTYFDTDRPNLFMLVGVSNFGSLFGTAIDSTDNGLIMSNGVSMTALNIGFGREFYSNGKVHYFDLGPTYLLSSTYEYTNLETGENIIDESIPYRWLGFFEYGWSKYQKKRGD